MTAEMTATAVSDVAATVLAAVSVGLTSSSKGKPDRVLLSPGAETTWDNCQCGQLAVYTGLHFNSRSLFGDTSNQQQNCVAVVRAVNMAVEIVRCVPISSDNGTPPKPADLTAAFMVQEEDAYIAWVNTECALVQLEKQNKIGGWVLNAQTPIGPQGGCGGTRLEFVVGWWRDCVPCGDLQ